MRGLGTATVVAAAIVAGAAGAAPAPLDPDELDRGIAIATPAVYQLDVTVDVGALTHAGGRLALSGEAGRVTTSGTAFGVAEGGWLAAAGHVVAGDGEAVAVRAYQQHLRERGRPASEQAARLWVARVGARPARVRIVSRSVARSDRGPAWSPRVVRRRTGTDLALLRIAEPGAPALDLDDSLTRGTPVAALSYRGDPGGPTAVEARTGTLGRTGIARTTRPPGARRTVFEADVGRGDSGAPVVDAEGRVRGMIVALARGGGGTIEPSPRVRALLPAGAVAGEGAVGREWRAGLASLWALDFPAAERAFARVATRAPAHPDAARERDRAAALAAAGTDGAALRSRRALFRLLVAVAVIAAAAALAALAGLVGIARRPTAGT